MAKIQPQSVGLAPELPQHVGIIMDGNGRYATRRGLPRKLGHRAGMERLKTENPTDLATGILELAVKAAGAIRDDMTVLVVSLYQEDN